MKFAMSLIVAASLMGCSTTATEPTSQIQKPKYETYIATGDTFPITQFTDIEGKEVVLDSEKRKLVLLFATWCSDSQRFVSQLVASSLVHAPDIQIIAVGREESKDSLAQFATKYKTNFTMVADPNRDIYKQFANAGVPRVITLSKDNTVRAALIGEDPNTLERVTW